MSEAMLVDGLDNSEVGQKAINMIEFIKINKGDNMTLNISNEDERIVAGWISVEVKDLQGDLVPIDEIEKAMYKLMDRGGGIFYGHSNKPVGKILRWEVKKNPETGKMGVYVVAKIFRDYKIDDMVWEKIKKGIITGFSVGGTGKQKTVIMKDDDGIEKPVRMLTDIELCEISLVERPANPYAKIDFVNAIAKSVDSFVKGKDGNWYAVTEEGEYLLVGDEEIAKMAEDNWRAFISDMMKRLNLADLKVDDVWLDEQRRYVEEIVEKMYDAIADELYGKPMSELKPDEVYTVRRVASLMKDAAVLSRVAVLREEWFKRGLDFDKLTRQISFEFDHEEQLLKCLVKFFNGVVEAKSDDEVAELVVKSMDEIVEIMKPNDLRPPKRWWTRTVNRLKEEGYSEEEAKRLAGWIFYHELNPVKPKDKEEKDKKTTRAARARKRAWLRNIVESKKMFSEVLKTLKGTVEMFNEYGYVYDRK